MQYVFLWVFPRLLSFKSRRFGTLYRFHLRRQVPMKMEPIKGSETSAFKTQTPGKYPKENILQQICSIMYSKILYQKIIMECQCSCGLLYAGSIIISDCE